MEAWSVADVGDWLAVHGLDRFRSRLVQAGVHGLALLAFTSSSVEDDAARLRLRPKDLARILACRDAAPVASEAPCPSPAPQEERKAAPPGSVPVSPVAGAAVRKGEHWMHAHQLARVEDVFLDAVPKDADGYRRAKLAPRRKLVEACDRLGHRGSAVEAAVATLPHAGVSLGRFIDFLIAWSSVTCASPPTAMTLVHVAMRDSVRGQPPGTDSWYRYVQGTDVAALPAAPTEPTWQEVSATVAALTPTFPVGCTVVAPSGVVGRVSAAYLFRSGGNDASVCFVGKPPTAYPVSALRKVALAPHASFLDVVEEAFDAAHPVLEPRPSMADVVEEVLDESQLFADPEPDAKGGQDAKPQFADLESEALRVAESDVDTQLAVPRLTRIVQQAVTSTSQRLGDTVPLSSPRLLHAVQSALVGILEGPGPDAAPEPAKVPDVVGPDAAFMAACRRGDVEALASAPVTDVSLAFEGELPLHAAVVAGQADVVVWLCATKGAQVHMESVWGDTAATLAAANGKEGILAYLACVWGVVVAEEPKPMAALQPFVAALQGATPHLSAWREAGRAEALTPGDHARFMSHDASEDLAAFRLKVLNALAGSDV